MRSKIAERILANTPKDVTIFVRLYAALVVRVNQILKEKGYSQKDLADKLEKSPSEIHKWLSGEHNFTLRSIAKLEAELGEKIIYVHVPEKKPKTEFVRGQNKTLQTSVKIRSAVTSRNEYKGRWEHQSKSTLNRSENAG